MKDLGKALAIVLIYLDARSENFTEDDDIHALEDAMARMNEATDEERAALSAAFVELGKPEFVEYFGLAG